MSETMPPDALVERLGAYFDEVTAVVEEQGGTVDKFIGDAVMALWGAPQEVTDHAARACESAIRSQRRIEAMAETDEGAWMRETKTRFGLATGDALVGNIGTPARMNYTAMGDVVNLAARLEGLNKQYGTVAMVSEATYHLARDRVIARPIDVVAVKGKARGVRVYELLALADEDHDGVLRRIEALSETALDAYVAGDFAAGAEAWQAVLDLRPGDSVASKMADRARAYQRQPPSETWSGVHVVTEK
jgi:adenylate cyclase